MTEPEDPGGDGSRTVTIEDEQTILVDAERLDRVARAALEMLTVPDGALLSVFLVDVERIRDLNEQAFGERRPTDVLSFPIDSLDDPSPGPIVLGDIVICADVAARQARGLGRSLDEELAHLLVHGILHLLGRDHRDPGAERAMAAEERRLLRAVEERVA